VIKLKRTKKGVLFFLTSIIQVFLIPFGFYEVIFGVIWGTEQFFSLVMVFYDIPYTFCYYANLLKKPDTNDNTCLSFIAMVEIMSIILFIFQLLKLIRVGIEKG
jgi:glucan phosphoethanolaminetransferase (alkaline phosphatase superfamily)